ncbi:MAG: hypothetical protein HY723_02335, partial [Chloroflexi bacterium]|nr:hypothetical protein [Chloroflexota bacterium]
MADEQVERPDEEALLEEIRTLLAGGRVPQALAQLAALHPADQAEVIAELATGERVPLLPRIAQETLADIVGYLREEPRREIVAELAP